MATAVIPSCALPPLCGHDDVLSKDVANHIIKGADGCTKVAEQDTYHDLMAKGGVYARQWEELTDRTTDASLSLIVSFKAQLNVGFRHQKVGFLVKFARFVAIVMCMPWPLERMSTAPRQGTVGGREARII